MKVPTIVLLVGIAHAQPAFEVASLKPANPGNNGFRGGCRGIDTKYAGANERASAPPLGRCVITDARLSHMIGIAFRIGSMGYIKGGPDWLMTGDRFSVDAKVEDPAKATEDQLLQMLQALLIERFNLKFHRETKDKPGYALLVAKNGPKIQAAKGEDVEFSLGGGGKPIPGQPVCLTARKWPVSNLATILTQMGKGPVVDKTGLTGEYDFRLCWNDTDGPSLFSALQEQLGLKFEAQRVPVSFFIVESAQKPTERQQ
jgi:uncharacterized protein (TIGR03435 family)